MSTQPLGHGVQLVAQPSKEADTVFADEHCPAVLWLTAGNHEDSDLLEGWERGTGGRADSFVVDASGKLRCIRDGHAATLPGELRVGALWGIDDRAPRARKKVPLRSRISHRSATGLSCAAFALRLTHDSPRDAIFPDSGNEEIGAIIRCAGPAFAFFDHYHGNGRQVEGDFGDTGVYHPSGLEMWDRGHAEEGSVGVLAWDGSAGDFAYLDPAWLRTFKRHTTESILIYLIGAGGRSFPFRTPPRRDLFLPSS